MVGSSNLSGRAIIIKGLSENGDSLNFDGYTGWRETNLTLEWQSKVTVTENLRVGSSILSLATIYLYI